MEHIISDERLQHINRKAYEAGKSRQEAYTQVGADGPEIIRCRDCKHFDHNVDEYSGEDGSNHKCNRLTYVFEKYHGGIKWLHRPTVSPYGFCAWAERDA